MSFNGPRRTVDQMQSQYVFFGVAVTNIPEDALAQLFLVPASRFGDTTDIIDDMLRPVTGVGNFQLDSSDQAGHMHVLDNSNEEEGNPAAGQDRKNSGWRAFDSYGPGFGIGLGLVVPNPQ